MRDTFIQQLCRTAQNDSRIMLVTGDLGFGVFDEYRKTYPNQFINAGVAEQNMTALATGLAMEGHIVFTYSIANFPTLRCLEQIRNDACYHGANVNVVSIGGGFSYGALGVSHHATEDLAIMRSLPDLTVVSPCGLWETSKATEALIQYPGACFIRLDKSYGDDNPIVEEEEFQIGKARILQEGNDLSIFVIGGILEEVQKAVEKLGQEGVTAQIISLHTLKPADSSAILAACRKTGRIVTVEEHTVHGGLGSLVAETLMDHGVFPKSFLRIALEAGFSSIVGSQDYLRQQYGLDARSIAHKIRKMLGGN
ncbi:MAG: transketolase [Candidatus Electrothrix sp. AW2]|nr:transketolase [Candidatus Electrothrix gigas]MCI5179925.1 transketolase [Candidatus Electrothrix gigas]